MKADAGEKLTALKGQTVVKGACAAEFADDALQRPCARRKLPDQKLPSRSGTGLPAARASAKA